jgi:hypothetical protein
VWPENVREVLGGVRGARFNKRNNARVCDSEAVCLGTNPTFSSFLSQFWLGTSWCISTEGVRVRA